MLVSNQENKNKKWIKFLNRFFLSFQLIADIVTDQEKLSAVTKSKLEERGDPGS